MCQQSPDTRIFSFLLGMPQPTLQVCFACFRFRINSANVPDPGSHVGWAKRRRCITSCSTPSVQDTSAETCHLAVLDLADIRSRVDSWLPLVAPIGSSFVILPCSSIPAYHNSLLYQFVVCPLVVHIDTSYVVYLIAISFLYQFCDDFCCNSFLYAHDVLSGTSCVVSLCNFNPGSVDDVCCWSRFWYQLWWTSLVILLFYCILWYSIGKRSNRTCNSPSCCCCLLFCFRFVFFYIVLLLMLIPCALIKARVLSLQLLTEFL